METNENREIFSELEAMLTDYGDLINNHFDRFIDVEFGGRIDDLNKHIDQMVNQGTKEELGEFQNQLGTHLSEWLKNDVYHQITPDALSNVVMSNKYLSTPQTIEASILKTCEYSVFPRLENFFINMGNHVYVHPEGFQDECASLTKKWTEGKTPEQQKFITDTFEKAILDFTKDYVSKHPDLVEKLANNPEMMEKLQAFQSLKVAPQTQTAQTTILAPKEKEEKKEYGTIKTTLNGIKKAGGTLLNALLPYKAPQLVEDVALVAEFLLDCLFGGVKGLVNGIKSDVKEIKQEQNENEIIPKGEEILKTNKEEQEQVKTEQEQQHPSLIKAEEVKQWTPELALEAVKQNGMNLKHIPEKMVSEELCFAAVANKGEALQFALDKLKNAPLCDEAMKENPKIAFLYVPDHIKTPEMCENAVKADGLNLQHVPREKISQDLSRTAVETLGKSLEFVPVIYRDKDMCTLAVKQEGTNLKFVPDKLKTKTICTIAQEHSTQNLKEHFPKNGFAPEKCTRSATLQKVESMTQTVRPQIAPKQNNSLKL
ncbi:hypothetical protein FACS1894199_02760 [Bacteroidia bacterium]|nr:hypothetical protein FACS1894199_02760 [Bacteroidia bacterium]